MPGRVVLKGLSAPAVSGLCGKFLDSGCSKKLIPGFVRKNGIPVEDFEEREYRSFNDFFARKIKPGKREFDKRPDRFTAPCDGLLSAYHIKDGLVIPVKQSRYSIAELLRDGELAKSFGDGICLVYRLCVDHYHRYAFSEDGVRGPYIFLPGVLHTVRPVALRTVPVFTENAREYTLIETDDIGKMVQMEVGAMLVGRISNIPGDTRVKKGREKGYFEYGGSTVIQLLEKDAVSFPEKLFADTERGKEIPVKMGQAIGRKAHQS